MPAKELAFLVLSLLFAPPLHAQNVGGVWRELFHLDPKPINAAQGAGVASVGDLDADGVPDFVFGAPFFQPKRLEDPGAVLVFSTTTGELLLEVQGPEEGRLFGFSTAFVGDVDGDGVEDFLVGDPRAAPSGKKDAGEALLFSGAGGALLEKFQGKLPGGRFGTRVAGPGDLSGDGIPDLLISAPEADFSGNGKRPGAVFLFSGADGALIHRLEGEDDARLGSSISAGPDYNGDGVRDVLVGAPFAMVQNSSYVGEAFAFSGATGGLLFDIPGRFYDLYTGSLVRGTRDLDGDGVGDFILGKTSDSGSLRAYSGADQSLLWEQEGVPFQETLGISLEPLSDLDGDGIPEYLAGIPYFVPSSWGERLGKVVVLSGRTGIRLMEILDPEDISGSFTEFGFALQRVGDLDGDGKGDFAVSAPGFSTLDFLEAGEVTLFSSATGSRLLRLEGSRDFQRFGYSLALGGDRDGDGHRDLLVGAPQFTPSILSEGTGAVLAVSGADRHILWRFLGRGFKDRVGWYLAGAGDVDRDGVPDVLASAPWADIGPIRSLGSVYLISGRDGTLLRRFNGTEPDAGFGASLAGVGDADGDGVPDIAIGAPETTVRSSVRVGSAFLYSGATGGLLQRWNGFWPLEGYGTSLAPAGDLDGDGNPDLLIGVPGASRSGLNGVGAVRAVSGVSGALIREFDGLEEQDSLGWSLAGGVDFDGDGIPDVVSGTPYASTEQSGGGALFLFSGSTGSLIRRFDASPEIFSVGTVLAPPADLDGDGVPDLVTTFGFTTPDGSRTYYHRLLVYSGFDGSPLFQRTGPKQVGMVYTVIPDLDGNGLPEILAGRRQATYPPVLALGFEPFLHPSGHTLAAQRGERILFDLSFPTSEKRHPYLLLASLAGKGPSDLVNLAVPLTADPLFARILGGRPPRNFRGAGGFLDREGRARAAILGTPALSNLIGRNLFLAAITLAHNGKPRVSSAATIVTIRP